MLGLKLRDEFLGSQMKGTAIALRRKDNTGAVQQKPEHILSITYPTADVQTALRALSAEREQRPIVLMGERGRGKSHIMAVMHHAIESTETVQTWTRDWGSRLSAQALQSLSLQGGFVPISEPVHNQEYPFLWDLIFDRHPKGEYYRGQFAAGGHYIPSRSLLESMFAAQPTALILDEFQTWFDGLPEQDAQGRMPNQWAYNFVQILSELSAERPDILILVVSVLNNQTEAFRQIHRNHPILIDFRGPTAKEDRLNLVLHRLFANRDQIPVNGIRHMVTTYADERFRLRFTHLTDGERGRIVQEVVGGWPFAPELTELLEDHILMAEAAQETRDLIRILAQVYRARGDAVPLITPADFFVDDDSCGVQSLLDSIATIGEQEKLREIAQRNLEEVLDAQLESLVHTRELVSALWMRSMSPGKQKGALRNELQLDITRDSALDGNAFQVELDTLIENSINIHGDSEQNGRLYFGLEENPRTKVRATARNDKLWTHGATGLVAGQSYYPGEDLAYLKSMLRYILVPMGRETPSAVVVLGPNWRQDPWSEVDEAQQPKNWDRPVLIVIPTALDVTEQNHVVGLGEWLAQHVPFKRNTTRFLLPAASSVDVYQDSEILFYARCSFLTQKAWNGDAKYRKLQGEFMKPLQDRLQERYDRFAILRRWDYPHPDRCVFDVEYIGAQGVKTTFEIRDKIKKDLFDPADFQRRIIEYAQVSKTFGEVLDELSEPPASSDQDAIPFLGENVAFQEILKIVSKGDIVLNIAGNWVGRPDDAVDDETALSRVRKSASQLGLNKRQIELGLPEAMGGATVKGSEPEPVQTTPTAWTQVPTHTTAGSPAKETAGDDGTYAPDQGSTATPVVTQVTPPETVQTQGIERTQSTESPNTGINLSGSFEKWGIPTSKRLTRARLEFTDVSVQEMKQILQRIPPTFRAMLDVAYVEEEEQ